VVQEIGFPANDLFNFCLILCFICFGVFFDPRPLFTLQTFHACLAFSKAVNHAALSSSEAVIPSFLLMFYLLKVPDLCSLYWCLIACLFLHSQTGFFKTARHRVKARHL